MVNPVGCSRGMSFRIVLIAVLLAAVTSPVVAADPTEDLVPDLGTAECEPLAHLEECLKCTPYIGITFVTSELSRCIASLFP